MYMKIFKKLLLIWMIVWLPAAGAAAAMMPLSGAISFAGPDNMQSADETSGAMPCHGKSASGKGTFGQSCSHCVLCHLAGTLALPQLPFIATLTPTHLFETPRFDDHSSFIPELTAPPPRLALA